MFDSKQEGRLAGNHAGKPGLPRGRSRLPAPAVHASQRERLLRAAVAAIAEKGYPAVTVADIVRRAKVSRAAFYLHFRSREDCFLAASRRGGQLLFAHVIEAARAVPDDAPDEEMLRAGQAAGEFREFDVRVMAAVIQRAVDGVPFLLETHPDLDLGAYAGELVTTFTLATRSAP